MERKEELIKALVGVSSEALSIISPLVDETIFIEENLLELRGYPFIAVNPKNPTQQKYTVAYKQYKELYQQYTQSVKILLSLVDDKGESKESPLQQYFKNKMKKLEV